MMPLRTVRAALGSVLAAASLLAAAGCDGDEAAPSPAASPTAPAASGASAEAHPGGTPAQGGSPVPFPTSDPAYDGFFPSAADLGEGWTREFVPAGSTIADSIYCGRAAARFTPVASANYASVDAAIIVIAIIAAFGSEAEAREAIASHRVAMQDCRDYVSTDSIARTEWEFEPASIGSFGDETLAIRVRGKGEGLRGQSEGYFAVARYGATAMATTIVGTPPNLTAEVAGDIAERIDRAYRAAR